MATANGTDDELSLLGGEEIPPQMVLPWDPCHCKDWDNEKPKQQCILRIKR